MLYFATTSLTIDSSGAHGNNGYKIAEEDLPWNGNGYKKPFVAEGTFLSLFGSIEPSERFAEPFGVHCLSYYTVTAISFCG